MTRGARNRKAKKRDCTNGCPTLKKNRGGPCAFKLTGVSKARVRQPKQRFSLLPKKGRRGGR